MKNPFAKLFVPEYETKILKSLEESLYDARRGFMVAVEAKQRADATLQYSTTRVTYLTEALAAHRKADNVEVPIMSMDVVYKPVSGVK